MKIIGRFQKILIFVRPKPINFKCHLNWSLGSHVNLISKIPSFMYYQSYFIDIYEYECLNMREIKVLYVEISLISWLHHKIDFIISI